MRLLISAVISIFFSQMTVFSINSAYANDDLSLLSGSIESTSPSDRNPTGLDSGRYETKALSKKFSAESIANQENAETSVTLKGSVKKISDSYTPTKKSVSKKINEAKKVEETSFDVIMPVDTTKVETGLQRTPASAEKNESTAAPAEKLTPTEVVQPSFIQQLEHISDDPKNSPIRNYMEELHPDDNRLNHLELTLHAGIMGNSSKSNYSFREYNISAPMFGFGAEFWATPFIGFYGDYNSTSGGSVTVSNGNIAAKYEQSEFGIDFRSYSGSSRRSNSTTLKVFWKDYKIRVPSDSMERSEIKTAGLGLGLSARLPHAAYYSSLIGAHYLPRSKQSEGGTALALSSGTSAETSEFGLFLGGEIKMSRKSMVIWKLQGQYEKSQYDGLATMPDPATGQTPSGVAVNNTFYLFSIGYQWAE